MPGYRKNRLKDLTITKVALVDEGACSVAHIKLYKRKPEGGNNMDFEEILKSLSAEQQAVVQDTIAKAKAELPEGAVSAEDAKKLQDDKMKAEQEAEMTKGCGSQGTKTADEVLKSSNLDPELKAVIQSALDASKAQQVLIAKMQAENEEKTLIAKTNDLTDIPEVSTKVVPLLKSIQHVDGAVESVLEILKSAQELIVKGKAFDELGVGGGQDTYEGADAAWAAIEAEAQSIAKARNVSTEVAIQEVCTQKPELYDNYAKALKQSK